ncbi:MAG: methylated-DNA--[protein]-cysteine S-methyltransferase [Microbacteriaceae bacterium]|jgi:methylated-DNA-[protein]-cysteine S-methyltransferase|nr:methylated-DNA--[protein]-cysteine S-methyltransferase [Microbacteriaceae bacterium]
MREYRRHGTIETELGDLTVVAIDGDLTGVYFPGHRHMPGAEVLGVTVESGQDPVFQQAGHELEEYLAGQRRRFDLRLHATGDAFSEQVWDLLRQIPYGRTTTYGALARSLGNPRLAQRVGQAVGRNPISIIIPCHRVVGADGSLTGYAGGLDRKRRLLELEEPDADSAGRLF